MPMLPGIDPNNRVSPVVKRAAVGAVDAVNRANVRAGNIVPGMRYNVQGNGAGAFPVPNQNNPLQGSNGSLPPRAIGLGDTPLVYKDQQLYRNDGPYVGVNAQSGTAIYDENGLIVESQVYGNDQNTWTNFDTYKTATAEEVAAVQSRLLAGGLLSKGSFVTGRYDVATQAALYVAMQEGNKAGVPWTRYAKMAAGVRNAGSGSGSNQLGPGDSYSNTQIRYTTKETAMTLIEQAIQENLGRAPTAGETAQFLRELRSEERDNPVVTTTTLGEGGDTTSETTGGLDAQAWAGAYTEDVKPKKQQRYKEAQFENALITMMGDGSL